MKELRQQLINCKASNSKLLACKLIGNYFIMSLKERKEICDMFWDNEPEACADSIISIVQGRSKMKAAVEQTVNGDSEKTGKFLKEAFCIDGEAKFIVAAANIKDAKFKDVLEIIGTKASMIYEMNDSQRGNFYITISK